MYIFHTEGKHQAGDAMVTHTHTNTHTHAYISLLINYTNSHRIHHRKWNRDKRTIYMWK